MYSFKVNLADMGEVEVHYTVTDPGRAPRYGEDPDPGHEPEIRIDETRLNGRPCDFSNVGILLNRGWTFVDEILLEEAYDNYGRCIL